MAKKDKKRTESVIPILQFVILCDMVSPPDQRGKVSFIGVFDKFLRPGVIPHFSVAVGWKNGKGEHKFKMRVLDPDLKQMVEIPEMQLHLKHETESARADLNIDGMNLAKAGVYWIEIVLNEETIQSIPLPVEAGKN